MKCPNCNTEIQDNEQQCPHCGTPLHQQEYEDEPTLGRGLVIFIIIGTIFLVAFGFLYYQNHKNDPEYTQTAIEPDSNLAEKNVVKFDTVATDTVPKDSLDAQEEVQAEKVFNSIRGKNRHNRHETRAATSGDAESAPLTVPSHPEGSGGSGKTEVTPVPVAPVAPKPHVEKIETE